MNSIPIQEINSAKCTLEILCQNIQEAVTNHKKKDGYYPWEDFERFQVAYRFFYEAWEDWGKDPSFSHYFKEVNSFSNKLNQTFEALLQLRLKTEYVLD